ncbi:MAG: nucleotide exchange factor GrpE, partial [Dehalococcoidia bacterium]
MTNEQHERRAAEAAASKAGRRHAAEAAKAQHDAAAADAGGPSEAPPAEAATDLREQLEAARAEAQENLTKYQRALADFQNFKRRTEEQRADYRRDANAALVINILPAIDDLDRALASVDTKLAGLQWIE